MKRVVTAGIGLAAAALLLVGCSDDKGSETGSASSGSSSSSSSSAGGASGVSTGGQTSVKVEGQDLSGIDLNTVTCVKQAGKINIASAPYGGGAQGLAVVMTDEATPKVESLGLVVDGSALAVSEMGGMKTGSAEVAVDGDSYTITGEAQGADMQNPMAGMITKKFEITVACS
ncbi:lipoprotein LpqH [Mycolicibacterium arenosum]|uniref:Lipoprotein LpqH n=1 Tax=Mycolicibacterium arenosum TaxID=2952157 RepID=A0ABT1M117_9MYCO|nr:lipoprotein LpqH [Mycolicibacterium sp. CAU 1645]MCP9272570.1 lipoprotein LpqH [Mycolicibacterium sp. CAU 1645]